MTQKVTLSALSGIKLIEPGDDIGAITVAALQANGLVPEEGDVLVVAQKIVSKAEGRYVDTATVQPSERAISLAAEVDKDGIEWEPHERFFPFPRGRALGFFWCVRDEQGRRLDGQSAGRRRSSAPQRRAEER